MESSSKQPGNGHKQKKNKKNNKPKLLKKKNKKNKQQIWRVKEKEETRNWLELPPEVTSIILLKLGSIEILETAQRVCTSWRQLCEDPAMWRSIDMRNSLDMDAFNYLENMAKHAIDRSHGQCVDINIEYFASEDLLHYITEKSTQLRCLRLAGCYNVDEGLRKAVSKLPLLAEIDISLGSFSKDTLEAIGRCCPLLRSFKLNHYALSPRHFDVDSFYEETKFDEEALTIAANMPELQHLMLFGNTLSNDGLQAILDGCPHLVSLDLRRCFNIRLAGDLGKRCAEQIKYLRRPYDSTDDYPFEPDVDEGSYDGSYVEGFSDIDLLDCDDFTGNSGCSNFSDSDDYLNFY